jgi:light-regulated signal transduction histidine kinase (bacteriophytochrome)
MAAFLAAAAWGLRRGVLDPVADLADQVRAVVSGDMHREVRAGGPKEIVELGADVDAMRLHISRELDVLQEVNTRLDEQARDLERSNRDLEQFAYVASHDLQEPLRKVSSFCQLLQRRYGGKLDERADQYIEFAADGAQRMQRLINDLLAFSRVGRTTSGFEQVDLREIALAAAAQLETTRAELGGEILVGDLPQVQGDPALLRQLLLNLFGNGMKFHRPDVPPVVRVHARRQDDHWELAVTDNGIGVEPEYAEKIFVIFQRLHGRDVYSGTGIGLALVKKIVEFHGGRVWLETAPRDEPGTVIRFTLPVEDAADGDPATESTSQEQP